MNTSKREKTLWSVLAVMLLSMVIYMVFVICTATRKPGCICSYQECVSSHMETSQKFNGKYWHDETNEVCDEYETVEYDCDCVTYHWFWGDLTR